MPSSPRRNNRFSLGDSNQDNVLTQAINQRIPLTPYLNEAGTGYLLGLLNAFVLEIEFNCKADTEVKVANPMSCAPKVHWLEAPLLITKSSNSSAGSAAARGYLNNTQSIAYNTWTKVALDKASFDEESELDTTNNRIIIKADGIRTFSGRVEFSGSSSMQGGITCAVYKNGNLCSSGLSLQKVVTPISIPMHVAVNVADSAKLVEGDYLELWAFQNFTTSGSIAAGEDTTYFSVIAPGGGGAGGVQIYRDSSTAWTAEYLGFKCSVDTSINPLSVKVIVA